MVGTACDPLTLPLIHKNTPTNYRRCPSGNVSFPFTTLDKFAVFLGPSHSLEGGRNSGGQHSKRSPKGIHLINPMTGQRRGSGDETWRRGQKEV